MMQESETSDLNQAYKEYLSASMVEVRERLRLYAARLKGDMETISRSEEDLKNTQERIDIVGESFQEPSPIDHLCNSFSLSSFERYPHTSASIEMDLKGSLCSRARI
jgi:hypothetical protein